MKISIIMVCKNAEKTIEQAIYSVITQTYKNIDFVIVDGKSTDNTIKIINKYKKYINYFISEEDTGIYNAMNKGINFATGEYIQFLNSDDALVNNNIINNVVKLLEKYSLPDILSAPVYIVDGNLKMQHMFKNQDLESVKNGITLPHQGIFCKKKILLEYKFSEKYKIASDYEFILKCVINKKKFIFMNEPVVFFSNAGFSNYCNEELIKKEIYNILKEHIGKYKLEQQDKKDRGSLVNYLKFLLKKIYIFRYIMLLKGWEKHRCNNKYCRWCKKDKE